MPRQSAGQDRHRTDCQRIWLTLRTDYKSGDITGRQFSCHGIRYTRHDFVQRSTPVCRTCLLYGISASTLAKHTFLLNWWHSIFY